MVNIDDNLHRKGFANMQAIKETRPKRRFRLDDDGFVSKGDTADNIDFMDNSQAKRHQVR
ncbi:TPA: hypothetical protein ACFU2Q_001333 [Neisseria subflava]